MMLAKLDQVIDRIASENKKIWQSEPEDVERLDKRRGTFNYRYLPVYVAVGTANTLGSMLYSLREASEKEDADLRTLKVLARSTLGSNAEIARWLGLEDLSHLLLDSASAVDEIESKEVFRDFVGQLVLYVRKISSWMEYMLPLAQMCDLYEYLQPER